MRVRIACLLLPGVDSAGALVLDEVAERVAAIATAVAGRAQVGFHGHENLALGVANTVGAIRAGAAHVDTSTRRFGAGAGNTPTEAHAAVCAKLGIRTGIDLLRIIDAAEDVVRPGMDEEATLSRLALVMGYAGVYSQLPASRIPCSRALRCLGRRDLAATW